MGQVYQARDTRLGRIVALKTLPPDLADDPDLIRRFEREARSASALSHPNVCTIHEIGDSDGIRFITMEYIEGQSLSEWAKARRRTPLEIIDVAVQLADALDEAHGKGIIHRDLKPANLMITGRGNAKILDFGLAKVTGPKPGEWSSTATQATQAGVVMGTLGYMSPEQVLGEELDARTDLFSLGGVLYEVITGRAPFSGANATQTMNAILHSEPEAMARLNYQVPSELERIVRKCLAKDRERRYQSARDLLVDFRNLKRDLESGPRAAAESPKSRRVLLWALSVIALLAALGAGYWLTLSSGPGEVTPDPDLVVKPLTSYPGAELTPSFSPDGNHVAFSWEGREKDKNFDIYVKQVDSDDYFRLTNSPEPESDPAWSPDGRWIAFLRGTGSSRSLILKSPLGGTERVLTQVKFDPLLGWGRALDWHPNGKWLVVADKPDKLIGTEGAGLFLVSLESGEKQRLTQAGPTNQIDTDPSYSPDGRNVAFARHAGDSSDVFVLHMSDGPAPIGQPRPLTSDGHSFDPAWKSPSELVYTSGFLHAFGLFRLQLDEGPRPRRIPLPGSSWAPVFSRSGDRLAYCKSLTDANIWQIEIQPNGKAGAPVNLISSTYIDQSPQFSPDGRRIAFVSYRSGNAEIWTCESGGSHPVQLTSFGGPTCRNPVWSADGKRIVFVSQVKDVNHSFMINAEGGRPSRLTASRAPEGNPVCSPDGKSIYFSSAQSGRSEIWKAPAKGGESVQITRNGGEIPHCSPDGRFIYYAREVRRAVGSLWRLPVEGERNRRLWTVFLRPVMRSVLAASTSSLPRVGSWAVQLSSCPMGVGRPVELGSSPGRTPGDFPSRPMKSAFYSRSLIILAST